MVLQLLLEVALANLQSFTKLQHTLQLHSCSTLTRDSCTAVQGFTHTAMFNDAHSIGTRQIMLYLAILNDDA